MRSSGTLRILAVATASLAPIHAMAEPAATTIAYDAPDEALDAAVEACLATDGVSYSEAHSSICYNSAIYPEQFMQLASMPEAERIIISSPGGNVATARMMSRILDDREEPIVIAGQCMSACAMVILPGADDLGIHRSAHIAVHGIAMMAFEDWFGWLKNGASPSQSDRLFAGMGYNFAYTMHKSGKDHMEKHLKGQQVDQEYIDLVSARMQEDALSHECRVDPVNYWGMLDAGHLVEFLGDRISRLELFDQSWDEDGRTLYRDKTIAISDQTYIFTDDYEDATCET